MTSMTEEQKLHFLLGATYQMAKQAKEDGLFKDLSVAQIASLFISDATRDRQSVD